MSGPLALPRRGYVRSFGIAEPKIRHLRFRPHRLGVLDPAVDPLRIGFVADVPEIGGVVALIAALAAPGRRILLGHVTRPATDALQRCLAFLVCVASFHPT